MKVNELVKLRSMKPEELVSKLADLQKQMVETRLNLELNKEKNLHSQSNLRRDIARVKTIVKERELASAATVGRETSTMEGSPKAGKNADLKKVSAVSKEKKVKKVSKVNKEKK